MTHMFKGGGTGKPRKVNNNCLKGKMNRLWPSTEEYLGPTLTPTFLGIPPPQNWFGPEASTIHYKTLQTKSQGIDLQSLCYKDMGQLPTRGLEQTQGHKDGGPPRNQREAEKNNYSCPGKSLQQLIIHLGCPCEARFRHGAPKLRIQQLHAEQRHPKGTAHCLMAVHVENTG